MPFLSQICVIHIKCSVMLFSFLSSHRKYKEEQEKQSPNFMTCTQFTAKDAMKDWDIPQVSESLGRSPCPTFSLQIPNTDICKGSRVGSSATCFSIPHESMNILFPHTFKFLSWKTKFTYETWALVQTQPREMGGGKSTPLTWVRLSAVSRPTANAS